jgi:murein L,D-transpeptidase YcbB/YkuD
MVPLFYQQRNYQPAWSDEAGRPCSRVRLLIQEIRNADQEGLDSEIYHLPKIQVLLSQLNRSSADELYVERLVDLDLLLTDAFFFYGSHLLTGRIRREALDANWISDQADEDLIQTLQSAVAKDRVGETLQSLLPPQPGYRTLKSALARYRKIAQAGGWPELPPGPKIRKGDRDARVPTLRSRLRIEGDLKLLPDEDADVMDDLVDNVVESALRTFQRRNGLDIDGILGTATLAQLNVPAQERVRQLQSNLIRWHWLPREMGQKHIVVNIAGFDLRLLHNHRAEIDMRVVVGRPTWQTPIFSDVISALVLSPHWNVPPSIARKEMTPLLRKDPGYFARHNIRVFQKLGAGSKEIDPATLDASQITSNARSYSFLHEHGPKNALGRVKFQFAKHPGIHLHDTPARALFQRSMRALSHGCIRIETPLDLAEYLLRNDPKWTREEILRAAQRSAEETVRLSIPIAVHVVYFTAWQDETGTVQFRGDIYGHDKRMDRILREEPGICEYGANPRWLENTVDSRLTPPALCLPAGKRQVPSFHRTTVAQ